MYIMVDLVSLPFILALRVITGDRLRQYRVNLMCSFVAFVNALDYYSLCLVCAVLHISDLHAGAGFQQLQGPSEIQSSGITPPPSIASPPNFSCLPRLSTRILKSRPAIDWSFSIIPAEIACPKGRAALFLTDLVWFRSLDSHAVTTQSHLQI